MISIDPQKKVQKVKRERLLAFRQAGFMGFLLSSMVLLLDPVFGGFMGEYLTNLMTVVWGFSVVSTLIVTYLLKSLDAV